MMIGELGSEISRKDFENRFPLGKIEALLDK